LDDIEAVVALKGSAINYKVQRFQKIQFMSLYKSSNHTPGKVTGGGQSMSSHNVAQQVVQHGTRCLASNPKGKETTLGDQKHMFFCGTVLLRRC